MQRTGRWDFTFVLLGGQRDMWCSSLDKNTAYSEIRTGTGYTCFSFLVYIRETCSHVCWLKKLLLAYVTASYNYMVDWHLGLRTSSSFHCIWLLFLVDVLTSSEFLFSSYLVLRVFLWRAKRSFFASAGSLALARLPTVNLLNRKPFHIYSPIRTWSAVRFA